MGRTVRLTESQLKRTIKRIITEMSMPTDKAGIVKAFIAATTDWQRQNVAAGVDADIPLPQDIVNSFYKPVGNAFGLYEEDLDDFQYALERAGMDENVAYNAANDIYSKIADETVEGDFEDESGGNLTWADEAGEGQSSNTVTLTAGDGGKIYVNVDDDSGIEEELDALADMSSSRASTGPGGFHWSVHRESDGTLIAEPATSGSELVWNPRKKMWTEY